jgi:DNA replication protein DnaC
MLHEQTHSKLIEMKMYGLAAAFDEYLNDRSDPALSFEERLGLMVDREWTERAERRLKRRLATAKLREQACVEDIDYRHKRRLDRSVMERLAACRWIAHHEALIITGPTGVGKTWIACALANKACREGYTALYRRVPRLPYELQLSRADGSYPKLLGKIAKTDLIVLDDLGLAPLGDVERRDLLEILEDRNGLASTIVTSQLPVSAWHDTIGDPTIADAILDRLIHNAHRLELDGPSIRKSRERREEK